MEKFKYFLAMPPDSGGIGLVVGDVAVHGLQSVLAIL